MKGLPLSQTQAYVSQASSKPPCPGQAAPLTLPGKEGEGQASEGMKNIAALRTVRSKTIANRGYPCLSRGVEMTAVMESQKPTHTVETLHKAFHQEVQLPGAVSRSSLVLCLW